MENYSVVNEDLYAHPGYRRLFEPDKLTFGLIAPMQGYPDDPIPDTANFEKIIRLADEAGIDAIWLRDVPFFDPSFGDAAQVFDALVYAGWIAGITKSIIIGTAGMVSPLRDPIILAKQASTVDKLSSGRMILGLASGDRASEYPAFGLDFYNRSARYREARELIRNLTETEYPHFTSEHYGNLNGNLDMIPKPFTKKLPTISIGRAGQSLAWMAEHMDGWIWHGMDARRMTDVISEWKAAGNGVYKPYGYGVMFDLSANPDEPIFFGRNFVKGGRHALVDFWESQRQLGLSHLMLNLRFSRRPAEAIIEEFAQFVLPQFRK